MEKIKITFIDGTTKEFRHEGRPGGSYTKQIKYEGMFAIIVDEWGKQLAFPVNSIKEIEADPGRYY